MAKKIVRGITDVKTITNQDFDTNNVNDLLSDGQYNYIHRKKGESEEYHNLTDNIKTISSDNTELLSVTNNNKTTNTATLHPKHDKQKEQVLESTRNTISINHGTNGTDEKTTVDTNPKKVLEHSNLLTDYGISKTTTGNTTTLGLEYTKVDNGFDLNSLETGNVRGECLVNSPDDGQWFFVSSIALAGGSYAMQEAIRVLGKSSTKYKRTKNAGVWGEWREQVGDKSVIDGLLAQKQNTLISDSEYITLNHQQGENTTHIQTAALTQALTELYTIISEIGGGGGATTTVKSYTVGSDWHFSASKQVVTQGATTLVTFTFDCDPVFTERVLSDNIKQDLEKFVEAGMTVSNGAISITNDGTSIKLIKSGGSQNTSQQGTFTFFDGTAPI